MEFVKAEKERARLRLALAGPSGSGKTFTALRLAAGIGGRVALVDTEHNTAIKYVDRFEFDVLALDQHDPDMYAQAIALAGKAGYDVLIIDSLTHAWQALLNYVDQVARTKFRGNTWSAWSEGRPKQKRLVDAILAYPGHVIVTMRVKTDWAVESDGGKSRPVRVGLAPEQDKGIEYEFDMLMELNLDHAGHVTKDRSTRFQDRVILEPGEDLGHEMAEWLMDGAEPKPRPKAGTGTETVLYSRAGLLKRLKKLQAEADQLGIEYVVMDEEVSDQEILDEGKRLAAQVNNGKE